MIPADEQRAIVRRTLVESARRQALDRFVDAYLDKWRSRMVCAPAYLWQPDCGNYDGTPVPVPGSHVFGLRHD